METRIFKLSLLAVAALTLTAGGAAAGEFDRSATPWYLGFGAGLQNREKASDEAGQTTFDTGYALNGVFGRRIDAFRVDAELSYFKNDNDTTDPTGPLIGKEDSSGYVDIRGYFLNAYYDFDIQGSAFSPYIGAGIGRTKAEIHGLTTPSLTALPPEYGGPIIVYGDSDWETTYQLRVGASYALSQQADVNFGYRYVKGDDMRFELQDGSVIHPNGIELHNLEVGLRVAF